jgi:hypothetical protein
MTTPLLDQRALKLGTDVSASIRAGLILRYTNSYDFTRIALHDLPRMSIRNPYNLSSGARAQSPSGAQQSLLPPSHVGGSKSCRFNKSLVPPNATLNANALDPLQPHLNVISTKQL